VERSDERRGAPKPTAVVPPPLRPDATPAHVLRDRIRNASAAAAKRNSTLPPPPAPAGRTLSSPPEHSGVRSRPAQQTVPTHVSTSSLFSAQPSTLRPPPVPRETTLAPEPEFHGSGKPTQLGLGAVQPNATPARTKKVTPDLTTAKTQPMPRVSVPAPPPSAAQNMVTSPAVQIPAPKVSKAGPVKSPVPGLLRASQPATPREGRYSVRDVSAEYIEPRTHSSPPSVPVLPSAVEDDDDLLSRSRRSTPKERPNRRRPTHLTREEAPVTEPSIAPPPPLPRRSAASTVEEHVVAPEARPATPVSEASAPPVSVLVEPAVVVDPQLGAVTRASRPAAPNADRYTPLPNDRESFEAFMRERMKDSEHARPGWSEQDTKLIARESLSGKGKGAPSGRRLAPGALVIVAVAAAAGAGWWVNERGGFGAGMAPTAAGTTPTPTAANPLHTLIVTEPAGAEIVLGGAVIGNTPSEVPRAAGEELYLLRLSGFESQLVRLTAHTRDVVRVTLKPLGMPGAPTAAEIR
jgi:hypothetical protein